MNSGNFSEAGSPRQTQAMDKVVLLIEDEPGDIGLIRLQLLQDTDAQYEVHVAQSMAQARQLVQAGRFLPDVVLLDLNLPDSQGVETVQICRSLIDAPVIVLTGLDDQAANQAAIQSGAEDYLSKGGEAKYLHKALRYAMLRYQRDSDLRRATAVLANSYDGIMITNAEGVIVEVNPALCRITGYSAAELLGHHPRMLSSGRHDRQFYARLWRDVLDKGVWQGELVNRHKAGHLYYVDESITLCRNGAGRIQQFIAVISDITERRIAQEALQRTNTLLQGILESIPVALCAFDQDLNLIAKNRLYQSGLDLPDHLFQSTPVSFERILQFQIALGEFGAGDQREILAERVSHIRQGMAVQYERTRPDGTVLDIRSAPMPEGGFVTTFSDITERQRAQGQALQNMQLLRGAIDSIDEAFVIFDADDRLLYCNEKYRRLYALASDVITPGARFEDIVRAGAQRGLYPDAAGQVDRWVAQRVAAHQGADRSMLQRLSDGRILRVIERRLPDGCSVGYRIDITDLVRATEEAQAANVAKSRFLATMSHEIRTPMNGILGMAQLLNQTGLSERDRQEYARTVLSSGQSLLALLNDILDLSKIEAGRMELDCAAVSPAELMRETMALFSGAAKNKGLLLEQQWMGQSGARYLTDAYRLRQMLSNLVGNAIKFTSQGRVRIEATELGRVDNKAELEFVVSDTGIGIAHDKQLQLFEAFSQADSSTTREYGGSGLGLSIVSRLATLFGGTVGVHSEPGQGARFWFRVSADVAPSQPLRVGEVMSTPSPAASPTVVSQQFVGTVLVAEDNAVNCLVIEGLLGTLGLHVRLVGDGAQAVAALAQGDLPDLVLMDLHMPVMDGYNATLSIRQHEQRTGRKRVPVIALTADAFEDDRLHCLSVGMDDFLTKPIALEPLRSALAKWLIRSTDASPVAQNRQAEAGLPDSPQLQMMLNHTLALLALHKYDAIEQFEALLQAAAGSSLTDVLHEVAPLVQALRFEEALTLLQPVSARPEV
jgi:PAS domain S-box-containing protein